jgi:hypothetical protein
VATLQELGLPHTIFRPVWFMENWEGPYLRSALLAGTIAMPLDPDVNFQQVTVADVGAFAALAFGNRENWLGRAVDLAGDERPVAEVGRVQPGNRPEGGLPAGAVGEHQAAGDECHVRWFRTSVTTASGRCIAYRSSPISSSITIRRLGGCRAGRWPPSVDELAAAGTRRCLSTAWRGGGVRNKRQRRNGGSSERAGAGD